MRKIIVLTLIIFCSVSLFSAQGDAGWLNKIIKRMMREGVNRVDSRWDDAHAAKMAYDAYVLVPKIHSGSADLPDVQLDFTVYDADISAVKKDIQNGIYGPTTAMLAQNSLEVIRKSKSRAERKKIMIDSVEKYKLDAITKFAGYEAKAKEIKDIISTDLEINSPSGYVYEQRLDVLGKKTEALADNLALRVLLSEVLALKVAVTGEMGILGSVSYANYVGNNIGSRIEIYNMVSGAR